MLIIGVLHGFLAVEIGAIPESGSNRVNRGGSWNNTADNLQVGNVNSNTPDNVNNNLGLRLVSTGA